jgi:alkylation response protein AidB-like acyl-CoA dehydrogenase
MKLGFTPAEEKFRADVAVWLDAELSGRFRDLRGVSSHTSHIERRREWEQLLGRERWSCIGWPATFGGRGATLAEQVIFAEEYARALAPARLGHLGIELAGPTLLAFGTEAQKHRFLPPIARGEEFWCQGYSEPDAGSDLANVKTRARLERTPRGMEWVVDGQKVWTSLAQFADWVFALCRTEQGSRGNLGLAFLLIPVRQNGVSIRPIREMTGEAEFNEMFFTEARTAGENVVGAPGEGWKVAMGTLAFERGISTLGQQMAFRNELDQVIAAARANGTADDPTIRQRIAAAYIGLRIMRYSALRMLSGGGGSLSPEAFTYKIFWATWRRNLGELAMDVLGPAAEVAPPGEHDLGALTKTYLFARADTIYGGTNQIQRNLIAERALGLPKEPRGNT